MSWATAWRPASAEPAHPLASLEGQLVGGTPIRVRLGPKSRFGARYFALFAEGPNGELGQEPILTGLHGQGPLPSYNWVEVAETRRSVRLPGGASLDLGDAVTEQLFRLLLDILPPGGHLMVEYDSPERAETARALAMAVPHLASPLGEVLFRIGCGARFKDWQIAEGGAEGPRKLQAYKPPSEEVALRWREEAAAELRAFLLEPASSSDIVLAARERAARLRPLLASSSA